MPDGYMAIDPGGTCGWATFDPKGQPLAFGEAKRGSEFFDVLRDNDVAYYVVENYRIRPHKISGFSHEWDEALTARDIGAVELWAYLTERKIILQEPAIKPMAAKMFGLPNNASHQMNAMLHGVWHAHKELGLAPPKSETGRSDSSGERVRRTTVITLHSGYKGLRGKRR